MKRKAESGLIHCAENFCVRAGNPPEETGPVREPTEPIGEDSYDGVTDQQASPMEGHVAGEASSPADAFWALLERACYTVW